MSNIINFQEATEPFFKRPLDIEARKLFEIYMSNFIDDWKEISNHQNHSNQPSELHHSTFHLVNNKKWTPPTSLTILSKITRDTDGIARSIRSMTHVSYILWKQPSMSSTFRFSPAETSTSSPDYISTSTSVSSPKTKKSSRIIRHPSFNALAWKHSLPYVEYLEKRCIHLTVSSTFGSL